MGHPKNRRSARVSRVRRAPTGGSIPDLGRDGFDGARRFDCLHHCHGDTQALRNALAEAGFGDVEFRHDSGPAYRGFGGYLKACARTAGGFFLPYPSMKNIVVARKR